MFSNKNLPKICPKFYCEKCDYGTSKKSSYDDHLFSKKHNKSIISNQNMPKICSGFVCDICNKIYKDNSGLWRHKKKYNTTNIHNNVISTINDLKSQDKQQQLIEYLLKENSEFKQMMVEQNNKMFELAKNSGNNNNNNTTSNIVNNNNFNLNFFLNETCKNAMNITDFVSQLQVGIKDLEETGRLGFSEGISKIIINGLKKMDVSDRPIHCSDSKREIVYIKDKDQWNKESEDKSLLTNAIKHVAHKNMRQISEWTKDHPEYNDSTSKQNDKYLRIVSESMSGSSQEETNKNYNKIIKNIAKETIIDKTI
jgi:hypothetical protein